MRSPAKPVFFAMLAILGVGLLLSLSIFPEAFFALIFNDTGEPPENIAAAVLPGFATSMLFAICMGMIAWPLTRFSWRGVAAAVTAIAALVTYLSLVPAARQGFRFDLELYQQSCAPHSTAFLC